MLELLHRQSNHLFKTNLGLLLAVVVGAIWLVNRVWLKQEVDIPNVVSLIGFILLFSLERSHGREMKAIHLKLDELLAAQSGASNRLIRAEEASEEILNLAHEALHSVASSADSNIKTSIDQTDFFTDHELTVNRQ